MRKETDEVFVVYDMDNKKHTFRNREKAKTFEKKITSLKERFPNY